MLIVQLCSEYFFFGLLLTYGWRVLLNFTVDVNILASGFAFFVDFLLDALLDIASVIEGRWEEGRGGERGGKERGEGRRRGDGEERGGWDKGRREGR